MPFSRRSSKLVAVLATAAVVPAAALGVPGALAQSGDAGTTQSGHRPPGPGRGGPDVAKLATTLGVTQAQLKAALDATRPTGRPGKGDRGAGLAAALATELGVSPDKVQTILAANKPAKPTGKPAAGKRPGDSALVTALSTGLSIDKANVQGALDKLHAARKTDDTAREAAIAASLAKQLNLDAATVQKALAAQRPTGRP